VAERVKALKSAFVSVVGRPSAGKSTLTNALCGHKLAIVSPVPQTTRNRIRGIVTTPVGQLVLLDTPGYHLSERRMNRRMRQVALDALAESDIVLYVVDTTRPPGEEESALAERVAAAGRPTVVALNKMDIGARGAEAARSFLSARMERAPVMPVSALTGEGAAALLEALFERAPVGDIHYDAEMYTDQDPAFRIAEILREKAIHATTQEVPHCLYVDVADLEQRQEPTPHLWVRAFLVVERESQKGILVGRGGERIREIVAAAARECSEVFPQPVRMDVRVRARPKWRTSENVLKGLVY
jgi:GTP-binding protein Era